MTVSAPLQERPVLGRQKRACRHEDQSRDKGRGRRVAEDGQSESRADEGCNGVVSTRTRRPQHPLGVHVAENAHAVSHKAHCESRRDCHEGGGALTEGKPDGQRPETRKNTLEQNDDQRILVRQPPRAVVLNAPAQARPENEQRPRRRAEGVHVLHGEESAGQGDEDDPAPQTGGDGLAEQAQGDEGGGDDLEVSEEGSTCRRGCGQAEQKQNGRGDVQPDHEKHEGGIRP